MTGVGDDTYVKNDHVKFRGRGSPGGRSDPPQPRHGPPEGAAHAQRCLTPARRRRGGAKMAAVLLARLCRGTPGLRGTPRLRAACPPLSAAPPLLLRRPAAPLGPRSFSAAELVRAAPAALQPYLRLMRLHQPAGERGREGRGPASPPWPPSPR